MAKIPEYILEAINCGEAKACDYYEEYGKETIDQALQELKNSDEQILSQINTGKLYDAVNGRLERESARKRFASRPARNLVAVAAVLLLVLPGMMRLRQGSNSVTPESAVRTKGDSSGPQLFLYQQKDGEVLSLKYGTKVEAGDLVQLAYNPNGSTYGLIFSIDGNQNVTIHYGDDYFNALELKNEVSCLDFSYELDDAPEYEVFIMIASDKPFNFKDEVDIMKNKNLKYLLTGTYVHEQYEYATFVLKK